MRLRYQMRGLGIGIIVTALLMGVTKGNKVPLSDAEIKVRALALGMVESDSLRLSDVHSTLEPSGGEGGPYAKAEGQSGGGSWSSSEGQDDGSQSFSESQGGDGSQSSSEGQGGGGSQSFSESQGGDGGQSFSEEQGGNEAPSGGVVTFTIEDGVYSSTVCAMLEDLGLVESASDFQQYLHKMGYTRVLRAGTYEVAVGTSMKEIAKIITKK